jgi:hypothetical protein
MAAFELETVAGRSDSRMPGIGSEPTTLSTAIFSGMGTSSARGIDSRLSRNKPIIWSQ